MNERLNRPLLGGMALALLLGSEDIRAATLDPSTMGHGAMDHGAMGHAPSPPAAAPPRTPLRPVTEADRQAAFAPLPGHQVHDRQINWALIVEELEYQDVEQRSALSWKANAWVGGDIDRLWLRSEGEREQGKTHKAELQALWGHAVSPWWELVAGVRQDFKPASGQSWAALGIQGTPLYGLELQATLYAGERQQTALRLEAAYAILLTQRWRLEPTVEVNLHGRNDPGRGQGSGLSDSDAGLRLRYEITPWFAPYVGVSFNRLYGDTARMARDDDGDVGQTRWVAGVRFRF